MNTSLLIPAAVICAALAGILISWLGERSGDKEVQRLATASEPDGVYGHPFDPVVELKKELPSPPPGFMWELTVERSAEYCNVLTLGLLHTATGKVVASKTANLTKNGNQEWRALYGSRHRPDVAAWARGVIVDHTVEWAQRQKNIHTPPDGPSHYEVIA
ncbi:hypothetical protein [Nocardia nova]|nr:hypothetical protein [Nocardia nova]